MCRGRECASLTSPETDIPASLWARAGLSLAHAAAEWGESSLLWEPDTSTFAPLPAEDRVKDGQRLKQLLLKALTLMLDAAESYAKVIGSLGAWCCRRSKFVPLLEGS